MMIIETRQAAKDKAFDLIDEMKDLSRKKKMALCELEETLYECFETSDDDEDEEDEEKEYESGDTEDQDADFRSRRSYKYGRRHAMRHDDDEMSHLYRRRAMRMRRRDRMGRFV